MYVPVLVATDADGVDVGGVVERGEIWSHWIVKKVFGVWTGDDHAGQVLSQVVGVWIQCYATQFFAVIFFTVFPYNLNINCNALSVFPICGSCLNYLHVKSFCVMNVFFSFFPYFL